MPNPPTTRGPRVEGERTNRLTTRGLAAIGLVLVLFAGAAIGLASGVGGSPGSGGGRASAVAAATTPGSGTPGSPSPSPPPAPSPSAQGTSGPPPSTSSSPGSPGPIATPVPTPTPDPSAVAASLDAQLEALRAGASIPGVSAAIVWDDGRRWLGAAGSRNVAAGDPMTTDTAFALASVSKTFTAAVVLQLVGEGSLALDQPVAPLLAAYHLDPRITVRMLLDHTSGLPDYFLNPKIEKPLRSDLNARWTPLRSWGFVLPKRPVPGTAWVYSNANYLLLGELVAKVTGHPLAAEIRNRLLRPLGIGTAWYQAVEKPRAHATVGYRMVARTGGGLLAVPVAPLGDVMPFRSVVTAAGGAGSLAATAVDAALWMQAYASGREVSADLQAASLADATATKALGARIAYGLGIEVVSLDGRVARGHSGRYTGFRNVVLYVPEAGLTIAVLTNQSAYDPARIATILLRTVAPRPVVTPSASPSIASPGATGASPSSSPSPSP